MILNKINKVPSFNKNRFKVEFLLTWQKNGKNQRRREPMRKVKPEPSKAMSGKRTGCK